MSPIPDWNWPIANQLTMGTLSRFFSQMEGPQGAASYPGASWDFRQVVAAQRSRESFKNAEEQLKAQREFFVLPITPCAATTAENPKFAWVRGSPRCPFQPGDLLTIIPRARMGSESIAHDAEGWMGYWVRGHEGERNNCFSKIQLVVQKYRE